MTQLAGEDEGVTALDVHRGIQALEVGAAAFVIHATAVGQGNEEGPFALVSVHVQLLPFLARDVVLDDVRFAIIQLQMPAVQTLSNSMNDGVNWMKACVGQGWELPTSQRLLGVCVCCVLSATNIFRHSDNVIAFK